MYWFGWLLGYIIGGIIFGLITKYVAESKGYDGGFAWGFWLGIIGLLVVGFRPNLNNQQQSSYTPMYPEAQRMMEIENAQKQWICSCGQSNPNSINYCVRCRRTREEASYQPKITCAYCGAQNKSTNITCFACGKPLKEKLASVKTVVENISQTETGTQVSGIDVLTQLAKLHEQGVLTDEEFQKKKEQILSQI